MNILIVTSWYPNDISMVNGIFVKEHAQALQSAGTNVVVFYPYDKTVKVGELLFNVENNIPTYRANTDYGSNSKLSLLNSFFKGRAILDQIVEKNNIDIINAHVCYPAGILSALYYKKRKLAYVITEHRSSVREFSKKIYNRVLFKFAYGNAKKVITVSNYLKEELISLGYKFKGQVIGNTVDVESFKPSSHHRDDNQFRILFVGSMGDNEVKGLNYFIPALSSFIKLNQQYKITATFVGEGSQKEKYIEMVKNEGIEENCTFTGNIKKEEVATYMAKCDFLVLPSKKETFGAVLIEAMASGKPVLCTRCSGPQEFINDQVGVLVDPCSTSELERGLTKITSNYSKFNPDYIRQYAIDNFGHTAVGNKVKEALASVLEK